jgi:hypothetical protein
MSPSWSPRARMLNEHAYCPRLAYLEWVQGDFADSADTIDGRWQHRNVDSEHGALPDARAARATHVARALAGAVGADVGLVAQASIWSRPRAT